MESVSRRHHYIPRFYLNGFTSNNGKFKIYDVEKNKFVQNGEEFSPKSYFYEKDANTLISSSDRDDQLEKKYSQIDDRIAKIFYKINESTVDEKFNLNADDIAHLQHFVSVMYWRMPANYDELKNIIQREELRELGLILKKTGEALISEEEMEMKIKEGENFFKMMKFWFPNISYPELFDCKTPLHIIPFIEGFPSICSDNPVISRDPEKFQVYKDDFILPINSTKVFMRGEKLKKFDNVVKIMIDTLVYKQAKRYVCCTDESYIHHLDRLYEKNFNNLNMLRKMIFEQIFE
jgi:hypothetical protein